MTGLLEPIENASLSKDITLNSTMEQRVHPVSGIKSKILKETDPKHLKNFIENWMRHGEDLKASYLVKYNQFIVLAVDENYNGVSGCSIDASVNLMKQFEKEFGVDLTNKLNISFKDGNEINVVSLADFQKFVKQEKITFKTVVFNNMVATKADFKTKWEVEAKDSWHTRFLTKKEA